MKNEIANTIKDQIGNSTLFMIGAKNLMALDNGLRFKVGRNSKSVNFVKVTLNGLDLYDIEYGWTHGFKYTVRATENDMYVDMLHDSIERNTGLCTTLPKISR